MIPDFDRISAGFLVKDRKLFVAQRKETDPSQPLKWELPGGTLEGEEKYDECLVREFKEEFGIDITVIKEIGSSEVEMADKVLIFMFFLVDGDYTKATLNAHKDAKLVSFSELTSLDLSAADKIFIEKYEEELKEYID